MLLNLLIALVPVGLILIASEILWRRGSIRGERARKFIHVLAGIWMAFWPLYLPFDGIFILATVALTLLIYSRVTNLFHAIYAVKRKTYGDLLYALGLVVCAYLGRESWIFTFSILLLALADGGAALVGKQWGKKNEYIVLGFKNLKKSIAGTSAFIALTYVCIGIAWFIGGESIIREHPIFMLAVFPLLFAAIENVSPFGLDNFMTPLLATVLLQRII